jgi:hydroxymethylpyrimidine pyrophosphatase-like HAD family hydrolase
LHGATTKAAAIDVESRFTEAALANVQSADYRNFAHGRHHWLARHATTSAILAFAEEGDDIARRTLALLPSAIPAWQVSVETGVRGAIAAVYQSLLLAHVAGQLQGIDPGCPKVPIFGRKLYHLRAMPELFPRVDAATERRYLAIERKARLPIQTIVSRGQLEIWKDHYSSFVERLAEAKIRAIAVDYDGTLCGPARRFTGPSDAIFARLNAILGAGFTVAIATGRGKSVRDALRKHITSAQHRARVVVGYHNGAEIGLLGDAGSPPPERPLAFELVLIAQELQQSAVVSRNARMEGKGQQITLELLPTGDARAVLAEASRLVRERDRCRKISVVTSSHSVDIIAEGVTKSNVVGYIVKRLNLGDAGGLSVLCIGDRGRVPGNDAQLLLHPLSLSVDEVGEDPSTCWNIAEPGLRFEQACLEYFTRLRLTKGGMRFDVRGIRS